MGVPQAAGEPDYYAVLGVPADASPLEIARAFRRLARTWHPDARPEDPSAAGRFRDIAAAYHVLSDPTRRAAHDRARTAGPRSRGPAGGDTATARPRRGRPVRVRYVSSDASTDASRPQRVPPARQPSPFMSTRPVPTDDLGELFERLRALLYGRW